MNFTDLFIRRPVFTIVLSLLILFVGIRAYFELPVRQYPNIDASVISVSTDYPGASAKLIEGFVTTPLENALSSVQGVDFMESSSDQGSSSIKLHFFIGYNLNTAIADVSNAVSSVRSRLPKDVKDPVINKNDPNAQPTIFLAFSSNSVNSQTITDYLIRSVQPQLQTLPGVGQAIIFGRREYAMRLMLDPKRMAAQNITASDVIHGINANNVQAAPGQLQSPLLQLNVNAKTGLNTVEQFNDLVLQNKNGYLTRLSDIGYATLDVLDDSVSVNINGNKNSVVIGAIPASNANPLDIAKEVKAILPQIKASTPQGIDVKLVWDSSKFIDASLKEVRKTFLEATLFVVLVIFLFLGSIRSVIIPVVTIPLSIFGVASIMLLLGYSINTLTLLALILAIGLVVDDAIVVLENIHRHIEAGEKPRAAAFLGAREIGFAIIAMTLTLAAVYAPIGFLTDLTGRLFREFAFTLAGAVIVSGFIALTLTPMMCSKLLKPHNKENKLSITIDTIFNFLDTHYRNALHWVLNWRKLILVVAAIIYASFFILYKTLPQELAPNEDQGAVLTVMSGPTSANLNYLEKYTHQIQTIFNTVPEKESFVIVNGVPNSNDAISYLILTPWSVRQRSVDEVIKSLFMQFWGISGITAYPLNLPPLPVSGGRTPIDFVLKTSGSYEDLQTEVKKLMAAIQQNHGIVNLNTNLKLDKPQVTIVIDRNKASTLGISAADIGSALNITLGKAQPNQFEMGGRSYYVIPELLSEYRDYPEKLDNIYLRTSSGPLVPLANVAHIEKGISPQSLNHFQQLRSASITGSMAPGYTLGQALDSLKNKANEILPHSIQYDYSGQMRQFVQSSGTMEQTFIFATIFIFLVLAAQFESFRDPLIVMMSVPLSLTGALIALHLTGATLNIYTQIGLVTLIGLISKHGILIVEFANKLQEKGMSVYEAVIESATLRLRPILMTTGAMLLGALPLVIASGPGAVARRQLGWTIFGGMAFGTLFTLFIIPTVYSLIAVKKNKSEEDLPIKDSTTSMMGSEL